MGGEKGEKWAVYGAHAGLCLKMQGWKKLNENNLNPKRQRVNLFDRALGFTEHQDCKPLSIVTYTSATWEGKARRRERIESEENQAGGPAQLRHYGIQEMALSK
ncbi:hypothetical protein Scep_007051 [Stephania cephalantha]|uniref:Uncharacterized protein n=1 Tax=Stephania cephalantha TaxID=152367 RepID=A0AAP0KB56_9MAGN